MPATRSSVLSIVRGREDHMRNVVRGLLAQDVLPDELVIGVMQEELIGGLPEAPFPIRQIRVEGDPLPLARARNTVARAARGEVLMFLDADCIPAPDYVSSYLREAEAGGGLLMGEVMYLPKGAAGPGWSYETFENAAERHVDRQGPPPHGRRLCEDYRCFWSLNFAMRRREFLASGGFDERYAGYGGEDTDFGRTLDEQGVQIWWIKGARAYHQYHPHCMPPVHHIPSILRNAELFAQKWGHRTMGHWLHAFCMMGLVAEDENGRLYQLREPEEADYALCRQEADMPFASSGRVVKILRGQWGGKPAASGNLAAE
ncbi:glycosyltransferase [Cribrihabitans neustonicus]|uniref:glycosyltransferase n=1 Tax=Cribrihabitans neustonicus TaxID=1429085 RepID=UPI003B5B6192